MHQTPAREPAQPSGIPAAPVSTTTPSGAPAHSGTPRIAVEALSRRYGAVTAIDQISLEVAEGEIVCLLGPSGSGKSTLLRVMAGIERPSVGRVLLDGVEVAGPRTFVEPERRRVGMVFQDYALFPHLTVAANVAFGLRGQSRSDVESTIGALLDRLGLRRYATSYPHMLSGGEQQRVALARALAPSPRVLLMDEPFSSLDRRLREDVRQHTMTLLRETRTTTVFVTHDPDEALRLADRIALLKDGRLVQCGGPEELYSRPATRFAARFFGDINELGGMCRSGRVETAFGSFEATDIREGATVGVCIRPEHLSLSARPTGLAARVLRTEFVGEIDHLSLSVPGVDAPIAVRAFGRTRLAPGDRVHVHVDPQYAFVLEQDKG